MPDELWMKQLIKQNSNSTWYSPMYTPSVRFNNIWWYGSLITYQNLLLISIVPEKAFRQLNYSLPFILYDSYKSFIQYVPKDDDKWAIAPRLLFSVLSFLTVSVKSYQHNSQCSLIFWTDLVLSIFLLIIATPCKRNMSLNY